MGGYSAKLASIKMLDRHHDSSPKQKQQHLMMIRDIITLATPHQYPLYAWDSSIYDIHQRILQQQQQQHERKDNDKQLIIVSLSGGLRDEMIEPYSCNANSNDDNSSSSFVAAATITVRACACVCVCVCIQASDKHPAKVDASKVSYKTLPCSLSLSCLVLLLFFFDYCRHFLHV